jgi:hypothetical protein
MRSRKRTLLKYSFILTAFLSPIVAPLPVFAQTGDKVVLSCTYPMGGSKAISLDLTAKTVSVTSVTPNPGGAPDPIVGSYQGRITLVTDEKVIWTTGAQGEQTEELNRYTGNLTTTSPMGSGGPFPCQRQQKQF